MKLSLLINMKMPTIVGIFIFKSRESYMLSSIEHEKKFYKLGARLHFILTPEANEESILPNLLFLP